MDGPPAPRETPSAVELGTLALNQRKGPGTETITVTAIRPYLFLPTNVLTYDQVNRQMTEMIKAMTKIANPTQVMGLPVSSEHSRGASGSGS